jgi:tetratricopeptide (TPR) repeat protein
VVFDQYRPRGFLNEPDWTHSDYLNTLSDYGLIGFALWSVAGGILLAGAWRAVRRDRVVATDGFMGGRGWRWGLFIGLVSFGLHLVVDFHTKIPALALAAAISCALLLRDDPPWLRVWTGWASRWAGIGLTVIVLLMGALVASPLYRSEALRYEMRRDIDRFAIRGQGDYRVIIPNAQRAFVQAVAVYPGNGQAWADLSYATVQSWHVTGGDLVALGREAEGQARRAVALSRLTAEYWVRLGTALDMQARHKEGAECFLHAVKLAPHSPNGWYHYAYHLVPFPNRKAEAKAAVATCLSLDPSYAPGIALLRQLEVTR